MKLIVGLGNPGPEYAGTRHNVGVMLVEQMYNVKCKIYNDSYGWRRKKDIMTAEFPDLVLVKTAGVFMNESGKIINELKYMGLVKFVNNAPSDPPLNPRGGRERLENLFVVHDDLDIKLGEYKIQFGTGPKVHNGVLAVERALGTKDFWRIRIGIDNRGGSNAPSDPPLNTKLRFASKAVRGGRWSSGEEYVLQRFSEQEKVVLDGVINRIVEEVFK
jgi:peptidyl-tRNA hydrolase, PTH1 family